MNTGGYLKSMLTYFTSISGLPKTLSCLFPLHRFKPVISLCFQSEAPEQQVKDETVIYPSHHGYIIRNKVEWKNDISNRQYGN